MVKIHVPAQKLKDAQICGTETVLSGVSNWLYLEKSIYINTGCNCRNKNLDTSRSVDNPVVRSDAALQNVLTFRPTFLWWVSLCFPSSHINMFDKFICCYTGHRPVRNGMVILHVFGQQNVGSLNGYGLCSFVIYDLWRCKPIAKLYL